MGWGRPRRASTISAWAGAGHSTARPRSSNLQIVSGEWVFWVIVLRKHVTMPALSRLSPASLSPDVLAGGRGKALELLGGAQREIRHGPCEVIGGLLTLSGLFLLAQRLQLATNLLLQLPERPA